MNKKKYLNWQHRIYGIEQVEEIKFDIRTVRPFLWETSEALEVLSDRDIEDLNAMIMLV